MSAQPLKSQARVLVVDDDTRYGEWLRHHIDVLCPHASVSVIGRGEFERWCRTFSGRDCDLVLLASTFGESPEDVSSPGLSLLRRLKAQPASPAVIALAEDGNELIAVRAMHLGAIDYVPKRLLTPERLNTVVWLALRRIEKRVARRLASLASLSHDQAQHERAAQLVAPAAAADSGPDTDADSAAEWRPAADAAPGADATPADGEAVANTAAPEASEGAHAAPATAAADATPAAATADAGAAAAVPAPGDSASSEMLHGAGVAALLTNADAEVIPGYTLRLKIGESEKAVVYLATSARRGHHVALKISKTLRDQTAGRQFLEREYTAIMAVRSPLVVEIYDYGVHGGFEYLAMEYLPRGDLKARIQRGVSERQAMHFLARIAAALHVVHAAGLVHRDLKPPNVMLRENDAVALIDFGLARSLDGATSINTRTGVLHGSPYYMSPEQALGETLDARSDFYSLGVICYEMLTGKKPYTGDSAMEVLQQHVNGPLPMLPPELARYQTLVTRLLAKSRDNRPGSSSEIIAAATALREGAAADEPQSSAA
ncbi:MAG TPA: protein kinase [Steroidobacteraceae bacterium]|nr:protein kinase [Steroidobacteraceae bacterium]